MIYNNIKPWNFEVKRVFVNEIYSYGGQKYQNKSGRNSEPIEGSDWISLGGGNSGGGGITGIITDLTLKGDGTDFDPVGLSQQSLDLIESKTVISATQTEVENQVPPVSENRKFITLFNIWKWRDALSWLILKPISTTAIANRLRSNGLRLFYANNSAVESTVAYTSDLPTIFNYTPTSNFTLSQIKTACENAGLIFNGLHIVIDISTNNFILSIDNGALNSKSVVSLGKRGSTGSISITSTRTLQAFDGITIMNGDENATVLINLGTSKDFIKINNG